MRDIFEWIREHILVIIIATILAIIMIFLIGLIALVIIASVKNENNRISEGTVIDKRHDSACTTITYINVGGGLIPQNIHHPESYNLKIQGEKNEEIVTYWFECTAEEYQQYKIGDYYRK